ncbi:hypothetical protein G6O69_24905 [Pseudenhygromyxa sp. WMMC2535]|uniref:hypothetical protein n=1 Tax=Pseudenhygromyxa sp. WMMC2535 TaxID=2712867 RepID=UPI00159587CE|nr:hypothetical protein [Pseudenhygromyxa sp. WMMC2535]NVB41103.1 hypothetical protein [Pseudenhygromyxa sp. WMMC2535]
MRPSCPPPRIGASDLQALHGGPTCYCRLVTGETSEGTASANDNAGPSRSRARWAVLALLALLLGATSPYFEAFISDNERPRLLQAMALVDSGETAIDGPASRGLRPGADVARADFPGARLHPNKPPGGTLPALLAYGLLLTFGPAAPTLVAFTALARLLGALAPTLLLIAVAWRRFGDRASAPALIAASFAYALATPASSYAMLLYGHQLTACTLFAGVVLLVGRPGHRPSAALSFVGGLLCALGITVEYGAVFAGLPIAAFLLWRARRDGPSGLVRAGAALAGALIPVAALAAYHDHAFGSPWSTSYHHVIVEDFAQKHGRGLLGLHLPTPSSLYEVLLSPWGGLLPWAPVLLVALAAGVHLARAPLSEFTPAAPSTAEPPGPSPDALAADRRAELRLHLAIFCVWLLVVLGLTQTGGWRVGPRYLVAAFPFLLLPLAWAFERARSRAPWLIALTATSLAGAFVNGLAGRLFPFLVPEGSPVRDQLLPLLGEGAKPWAVLTWGPAALVWPLVILGLLALFACLAACVAEEGELPSAKARALGLGVVLAAAFTLTSVALPDRALRQERTFDMLTKIQASTPGLEREPRRLPALE